jgi:hypothetical protein
MANAVKYPEITINLTSIDGNAFCILGTCINKMRKAGLPKEKRDEFYKEATSADYDHLLQTCINWFNVE